MSEKIVTAIVSIIFIGMLGLTVALGFSSSSFWAGALAFISVMLSLISISVVGSTTKVKPSFFILYILAGVSLAGATWLTQLEPRWMVIMLWLFTALPPIMASEYAFKGSKGLGFLTVGFALLSVPLAIALPAILRGASSTQVVDSFSWSWSLAIGGIAVLLIALMRAVSCSTGEYFLCVFLGLSSLAAATWFSTFQGGWWWALPWVAAAFFVGFGGSSLPKWLTKSGSLGIVIAILCGLVAVGVPLLFTGIIPLERSIPVEEMQVATLEPGKTLSALDISSTQLAADQATATQAYLDEQAFSVAYQTQTVQAMQTLAMQQERIQTAATQAAQTQSAAAIQVGKTQEVKVQPTEIIKTSVSSALQNPGFLGAIGAFLWEALISIWGILYLLIFFGLGQLWIRKWGGVIFLVSLLSFIGFAGGNSKNTLELLKFIISSGPTAWLLYFMTASEKLTGTIGWGIIGASAMLTILLIPALRITNQYSQKSQQANRILGEQGSTAAQDYLARNMPTGRENLAIWTYMLVSFTFPIALWVRLHRMSTAPISGYPFLVIPNLAIPHWKPAWHFAYFLMGVLFMVSYLIYFRLQKKVQASNPFLQIGAWSVVPMVILMTSLVPAGVTLFLTAQMLMMTILFPIVNRGVRAPSRIYHEPEPVPPKPSPAGFEAFLDEMNRIAREKEQAKRTYKKEDPYVIRPITPSLAGDELCQLSTPIIGGYLKATNMLCILDERSQLFWLEDGVVLNSITIPLKVPVRLLASKDDNLVAIGDHGQLIPITATSRFQISEAIHLGSSVRACALNAYGTLLAYVHVNQPNGVHGFFLSPQRDQEFYDSGNESISCLAFSQNARYLAIGTELGKLIILDISTHQKILIIPDEGYGPVRLLGATQEEKWVAVYEDGWVASWDMRGVQTGPVELTNGFSSLAVDTTRSRILVGDPEGYLWAFPYDLRTQDYGKQVQEREITHIFPAADGTIITVGDKITLRTLKISG